MRGLVLSGGGRKGAFQVGVIDTLTSRCVDWEFMAGTSVGAINVAFLAQTKFGTIRAASLELVGLWSSLCNKGVWKPWFLGPVSGLWKDSFYNSLPLQGLLKKGIDDEKIRKSKRVIRYGIVNYATGEYFEATERSVPQWKYVAASAAYPAGLNAIELPEGLCGDGGAVSATPLKGAIDAGCTSIDVILTSPLEARKFSTKDNWLGTKVNAVSIAIRSIDLLMHAAMVGDVERLLAVNAAVAAGADAKHRHVDLRVYFPERYLGGGPLSTLDFDPVYTKELIEYGRVRA